MIYTERNFLLAIIVTLIFACNNFQASDQTAANRKTKVESEKSRSINFDLTRPENKIKLPFELQEISALSYYAKNELICLHDEKADVFIINYLTGEVVNQTASGIWGDYEGIEYIKQDLWLTRSDGELTEFRNFNKKNEKAKTYKNSKVSDKNNVEGLGYDGVTNSLLMAFKNKAVLKDEKKNKNIRRVYRFDLRTKQIAKQPFLEISLEELEKNYKIKNFMPSGIASHPNDGTFYIISAVGNWLLVLSRNSEVIEVAKLDPDIFRQPEGICFSPDGQTLFISNEGRNKKGNVLIFKALN